MKGDPLSHLEKANMDDNALDIRENMTQLFATPLTLYPWPDSDAINTDLRNLILAKEGESEGASRSNVGGWHSQTDFFQWDADCVREMENRVTRLLMAITRTTMERQEPPGNLYFKLNGWANVNRDRSYNNIHNHPNSVWSGTYYVAAGEPEPRNRYNGKLELIDPRNGVKLISIQGITIGKRCLIDPVPGLMVMFPAWLNHQVHPFYGKGERISIAFNVLMREDPHPEEMV